MYSLARIIDIMLWKGGWVDLGKHSLLKDFVDGNTKTGYITINENWDTVNINYYSRNYIRIPHIGDGLSSQFFIKKNRISNDLLKKYDILDHARRNYNLFSDNGLTACFSNDEMFFGMQVAKMSDDLEMELPDISEYGMDGVLEWCNSNNINVIRDYISS